MIKRKNIFIALLALFTGLSTVSLTACDTTKYTVTIINETENRGTLYGGGSYKPGKLVTLSSSANNGYKLDKWDIDGEIISTSNNSYTFTMPEKDIVVKGSFAPKQYKVNIDKDDWHCTIEGEDYYEYGSTVTVKCIPNKGYRFVKWKETSNNIPESNSSIYTFTMPAKSVNLNAKIELCDYSVNIIVNDSDHINAWPSFDTSICHYGVQYRIEYNILNSTDKEHYSLKGMYLYDNGVKGEKINDPNGYFTMPDRDITIFVEVVRDYSLQINYIPNYETAWTKWMEAGTELSYTTIPVNNATYNGWYDRDSGKLLTSDYTYSFTMPAHDMRITTVYTLLDGDITFGKFPCSEVEDNNLIKELDKIKTVNFSGYIEYEGNEYISNDKADAPIGGILPSNSTFYRKTHKRVYYKVEPIKWYKVGEFEDGIAALICQHNLVGMTLTESDVNINLLVDYKDSSFRTYLNGDFYKNAFSSEEKNKIVRRYIDKNGPLDVIDPIATGKEYLFDYVFLPSGEDYRKLPAIASPMQEYLFYGLLTDFSLDTSSHYYAYNTTMLTNLIRQWNFMLRDFTDGYQMFSSGGGGSQYFTSVSVGVNLCVKPMILVKGL